MKTLQEQIAERYDDVKDDDLVEYDPYRDGCQTCCRLYKVAACNYPNSTLKAVYRRDPEGNYIKLPEKKLTWSKQLKRAGAGKDDIAIVTTPSAFIRREIIAGDLLGENDHFLLFHTAILTSIHRLDQSTGELVKVWPK